MSKKASGKFTVKNGKNKKTLTVVNKKGEIQKFLVLEADRGLLLIPKN